MRAASIAIQFESPKLAVTAHIADDNFAERLERALARSFPAMRVIEHRKIEGGEAMLKSATRSSDIFVVSENERAT